MTKTVICFWGAGNIGKTESVRALWEKLDTSHKPPLHEINRDICATVDFEGIRVGISSLGDPDSGQEMWLDELVGKECDIIVCASRTKGRTVRAVEERAAANGYALIWLSPLSSSKKTNDFFTMLNDTTAEAVEKLIVELINFKDSES